MKSKLFDWIQRLREERQLIKSKSCCACKYFDWYMGSAGVCTAKSGCPATRMKDYSEVCDCGCFKKKRG